MASLVPLEKGSRIMVDPFGGDGGRDHLIEIIGTAFGEIVKFLLRWWLIR